MSTMVSSSHWRAARGSCHVVADERLRIDSPAPTSSANHQRLDWSSDPPPTVSTERAGRRRYGHANALEPTSPIHTPLREPWLRHSPLHRCATAKPQAWICNAL